jgi:competence protein ComFC
MRLAYRIYRLIWKSLDWLYPPTCGGCGHPGERWCCACNQQVQLLNSGVCICCGEPLGTKSLPGCCKECQQIRPAFNSLRSWGVFGGGLRNAIHRLKYKKDIALGDALSQPLSQMVCQYQWPIDLIVAVPLSEQRYQDRGYNQASFLARPMALNQGIAYSSNALLRVRNTQSQVGLSIQQRKNNVIGAFQANPSIVRGRKILVVDDVATTGSTINACAMALISAGAQEVYGITLARPTHFQVE